MLAATWIGGGVLSQTIAETYKQGLYFIIPVIGDSLVLLVVGYCLAPRMAEFIGKLSIAEAMGSLYGKSVRTITTLIALISCIGAVAVQFKVSATILQMFFNVSSYYAVLISAIIVIVYSSIGGIKAVTFTDIIQIFTFATIIPIISFIIWGSIGNPHKVYSLITEHPLFDYKQVFNFYNPKFFDSVLLFLFFIIPTLEPAIFQRISMAKNTTQIRKSFVVASFICLVISFSICWVGILLLADNQNLNPNTLLPYIIDNYSYTGLKGLIAIGIMGVIMSTSDSYLNSAAVLFSNDLCKPLGIKWFTDHQLSLARVSSLIIGIIAYFLAFNTKSILELTFLIWGSYMPIISTPLLLAIFGFRSTPKSVIVGMSAGIITMLVFKIFNFKIDSTIPAMIINTLFFMGSHYLLNQPGGWVGIKDKSALINLKKERKRKLGKLIELVRNFNFFEFCKNNCPKQEYIYSIFGLFSIVSIFSAIYSIPIEILHQESYLLQLINHSVLIASSILITYQVWPNNFKNTNFISAFWNIALPYILVFIPTLLIFISGFDQLQLMILMVNIIILSTLLRWQIVICYMCFAVFLSLKFYIWCKGDNLIDTSFKQTLQFKIIYLLLIVSSVLVIFLKKKQYQEQLTQQKAYHLSVRINDIDKELRKSLEVKNEFLRNLEHEAHTPIVGIATMGQVLFENYDKLTELEKRKGLEVIAKSSERLTSFVNNMIDVSKLQSLKYELQKKQINLSNLIYSCLDNCKKAYLDDKELEFICDIEDNIIVNCDEHYLTSTLDNLIINAISYSKCGKITVKFRRNNNQVDFLITDEGIGVPKDELYSIFEPLTVSSKTKTPAGGRGNGLAVCKGSIEAHKGKIWCKSNGIKGSTFGFIIPIDD